MPVRPLAELAALATSRPPRAGTCRVVAVDGRSGAGKTTLARRLAELLDCPTLHMDHLYPGWDGLAAAPGLLVDGVLRPFAAGERGSYRRWSWRTDTWMTAERHVDPGPVLVVEGVGSGARVCSPYLSALVWVEAPDDVRVRRALARDGDRFGPHWQRWAAQEMTMVVTEATRDRADVVVDGQPTVGHDPVTEYVRIDAAHR